VKIRSVSLQFNTIPLLVMLNTQTSVLSTIKAAAIIALLIAPQMGTVAAPIMFGQVRAAEQEARRQAAKERADEKQRVTMMIAERETELRALLARWAAERELQRLYRRFGEIERLARLAD
jgi:3'-phosphoadenosine 5'-phosphosulfate (PAPS) 3'-phosphatase